MVGGLRDVITCAKFQIEIFMGYDFTGGRIFDFPIDFSMGLTTVQHYCAACDQFISLSICFLEIWSWFDYDISGNMQHYCLVYFVPSPEILYSTTELSKLLHC